MRAFRQSASRQLSGTDWKGEWMKMRFKSLLIAATTIFFAAPPLTLAGAGFQRIGVISASYSMQASGSGEWSWGDSTQGFKGVDQIDLASAGQTRYEVLSDGTNVLFGSRLSSTSSRNASGTWSQHIWDFTTNPSFDNTSSGPFVGDPAFDPAAVLLAADSESSGQFLGRCEKAVYGTDDNGWYTARDRGFVAKTWPPDASDGLAGSSSAAHAEDQVANFQFAMGDLTVPFKETFTQPTTVNLNDLGPGGGYQKGNATASCTITLEYTPDQNTITYSASPLNGSAPLTVNFRSSATDSSGNAIASWYWNYGDGVASVLQNPIHTYTTPGTYAITLLATNSAGAPVKALGPGYITVSLPAATNRVGLITITYSMQAGGSAQYSTYNSGGNDDLSLSMSGQAEFEILQTSAGLAVGSLINSVARQAVSGNWFAPGFSPSNRAYLPDPNFNSTNVCVRLWRNSGSNESFWCQLKQPMYGTIIDNDPFYPRTDGWSVVTRWPMDFIGPSGGEFATEEAVGEMCAVQLTLPSASSAWSQILTTNVAPSFDLASASPPGANSGSATGSRTVTIQYVPSTLTLPFTATATNGLLPLTVQFNSDSVDSGNTPIQSWIWNFGDGGTSAVQNPSHTYTNAGTFLVSLTAVNINGTTANGLGAGTVVVELPKIEFTEWPTNGYMPLVVSFQCPAVDSGDNPILGWNWDFGDNTHAFFQNAQHSYVATKSKTFTPKLTVTNIWGTALVATGPKISAVYPPILFTATPTNSPVPVEVQFSAPSFDVLGIAITKWNWDFGDGSSSALQNPTHIYTNAQIYGVTLAATNSNGTAMSGIGPRISAGCAAPHIFGIGSSGFDPSSGSTTNWDGIQPQAGLVAGGSRLYGVMSRGGNGGSGTIFAVNTDGSCFTNLHQFSPLAMGFYTNSDGAWPKARLVLNGDTLYGAASAGGMQIWIGGAIFKVNTNGCFVPLRYFSNSDTNGSSPNGLVLVGNTLYGTTGSGGANSSGTIFKLNTDGSGFACIHQFSTMNWNPNISASTNADGAACAASLIYDASEASGSFLYGTASFGGGGGGGTIFRLELDGSLFTVLHHFANADGTQPISSLVLSGDTLFGTTYSGGVFGNGTIFKLAKDGSQFATLYNFNATVNDLSNSTQTNADGAKPAAGLILSGNKLYGTTEKGGAGGSGTIFALNTDGSGFTNLYNFTTLVNNPDTGAPTNLDGGNPDGELLLLNDTLYATASNGGAAGDGAIFALNLGAAPPTLQVGLISDGTIALSWLMPEGTWQLQATPSLEYPVWVDVQTTVTTNGSVISVIEPSASGNQFYRLQKR